MKEPRPAIAFVGHQSLQHGSRRLVTRSPRHGDLPKEWGYPIEMRNFSKEFSNLHIGILSRLHPPEQFQNQRFTIEDRAVGLLGRADA